MCSRSPSKANKPGLKSVDDIVPSVDLLYTMKGPDLEVNHPRECVVKEVKSLVDIVKSGGASYEALYGRLR